jgi:hypothetical protein
LKQESTQLDSQSSRAKSSIRDRSQSPFREKIKEATPQTERLERNAVKDEKNNVCVLFLLLNII